MNATMVSGTGTCKEVQMTGILTTKNIVALDKRFKTLKYVSLILAKAMNNTSMISSVCNPTETAAYKE